MVTCGQCGGKVPDGKFCDACGAAIAEPAAAVAVAKPAKTEKPRAATVTATATVAAREKVPAGMTRIEAGGDDAGLAAGSRLLGGKYEIVRELGRGGMGIVLEARDTTLGRSVAIKRLRDELQSSTRDKARFLKEANTVAKLHHPAIVDIYQIIEEGSQIYLVLEYIEGKSVAQVLDDDGALPADRAVRVMKAVCEGLAHAHGRGLCHLDLKPSNVMIASEGYVKVMDFGIARTVKDTVSRVTGQQTSGTLAYMAPEQHLGRGGIEADIFAAGCTLYEMLTADAPFHGPDYLAQKREMAYRPISEHEAKVPRKLEEAIVRCLQSDPAKRFRSAGDLADAL